MPKGFRILFLLLAIFFGGLSIMAIVGLTSETNRDWGLFVVALVAFAAALWASIVFCRWKMNVTGEEIVFRSPFSATRVIRFSDIAEVKFRQVNNNVVQIQGFNAHGKMLFYVPSYVVGYGNLLESMQRLFAKRDYLQDQHYSHEQ
jgi:hypothetical protein